MQIQQKPPIREAFAYLYFLLCLFQNPLHAAFGCVSVLTEAHLLVERIPIRLIGSCIKLQNVLYHFLVADGERERRFINREIEVSVALVRVDIHGELEAGGGASAQNQTSKTIVGDNGVAAGEQQLHVIHRCGVKGRLVVKFQILGELHDVWMQANQHHPIAAEALRTGTAHGLIIQLIGIQRSGQRGRSAHT